jgi:signal transduction histidine kinase
MKAAAALTVAPDRPGAPWRAPLLVFVIAVVAIGSFAAYLAHAVEERNRAAFDGEVELAMKAMRERIETATTLLRGGAGLFAASERVDRAEFAAYVERLYLRERYPGIQGIGYSQRIPAGQLGAVVQAMRASGLPGFHVWPDHPREEYHSIVYLEPMDRRNQAAMGFDMYSEPTRREAMAAARDHGEVRASGPVRLVQEIDPNHQVGFLLYAPVYDMVRAPASVEERRARLHGFVYSPLRTGDLVAGLRSHRLRPLEMELYDSAPTAENLLYSNRSQRQRSPQFETEQRLEVGGREWIARFTTGPQFDFLPRRTLVPWLLLGTLGASLLLAGITLVQARAWRDAELAAVRQRAAAAALRDSEEHARQRSQRLLQLAGAIPELIAAEDEGALVTTVEGTARHLFGAGEARLVLVHGDAGGPLLEDGLSVRLPVRGDDPPSRLWIGPRAEHYGDDDRVLLAQLAGIAAIAWSNVRLYAELRLADRRKDEFLATLAHELRNPLAPICNSLEILRLQPHGDSAERARAVAARQARHMVRLIDDLLDISRISRGTIVLQRERMPIATAIEHAIEASEPLIRSRGHELRVAPMPKEVLVDGDATRLAQVFANLLNNAANYTDPGGTITVDTLADGDEVRIVVRDTGIGIEPQQLANVFDMFMQADRTRQHGNGLGIGLTLVRRLVEMHGGRVEARSAGHGRGSEFEVRLPRVARA